MEKEIKIRKQVKSPARRRFDAVYALSENNWNIEAALDFLRRKTKIK